MASGGLPPIQQMPPPRGWTPGAPSDPAQNQHDETIATTAWERLVPGPQPGRPATFSEQCENMIAYWAFLATDPVAQRLDTVLQGTRVAQLIRMHQLKAVDPKWVEEGYSELNARLLNAMSAAEHVAKKWKRMPEYRALKKCHPSAWDAPILQEIMSGRPTSATSTDYFLGECYEVCMRRLQVLLESKLDVCAYNLTTFLIKHVFEHKRPKFVFLHQDWLKADKNNANSILDIHLALMYRRKDDTSQLHFLLKTLPIESVVAVAVKCSKRQEHQTATNDENKSRSDDWMSALWPSEVNAKAGKAITEFAMCTAARKRSDSTTIKSIVVAWLDMLNLKADDSNLDIEVEKFVSLDEHSTLSYTIGHRLVKKYSRTKRELCLEQIVRGLSCDINKVEVARCCNDEAVMKKAEESLSYGLQVLAEVMADHLTFSRECILTAFSLKPTPELFERITQIAQQSGFVQREFKAENPNNVTVTQNQQIDWHKDFENTCQELIDSLGKGFGKAATKLRADSVLKERKPRNLEGLISIQGDLVTEAKNYDPVQAPLKSMTASVLGIHRRLVDDLLIMINAPRWHLLSWVLDWPQLEEQCQALLRNPDIKRPTNELKYLVIDYTQFDEWTSEEEITAVTGIEKGYENWVNAHSDEEEPIEEKGLDANEKIDFNVIPILSEADAADDDDFNDEHYVYSKDYVPLAKKAKLQQSFLAVAEETMAARSDLADISPKHSDCLLHKNNKDTKDNDDKGAANQSDADDVRATLKRVVPGLNDLSFSRPKNPIEYEVRVVQVSTSAATPSSAPSSSSSTTTSTASAAVTSSAGAVVTATTAIVASSSSSSSGASSQLPAAAAAAATTAATKKTERKVQYVYKQGGQTVLIDYPMTEDSLSKLKTASGNSLIVKQHQATPTVMISTLPKVLMSTSVDTLANSLISQITTPVNVQGPAAEAAASSSSSNGHKPASAAETAKSPPPTTTTAGAPLPKFQFAFGRAENPTSPEKGIPVEIVNGVGGRQVHLIAGGQRCIVQALSPTKLQYNAVLKPTNASIQRPSHVVVPVVTVEGGSAQAVIANARNVLAANHQQEVGSAPAVVVGSGENTTHADLIRQLNMARAQGLVVLQHWGDKQVLVHKATGRWIMRQGNRLVTVPPQALGITASSPAATGPMLVSTATAAAKPPAGTAIVRSMSSSTMEQLAEFDSILESKFKSSSPSPSPSLPDVIASTTTLQAASPQKPHSGPTFVIITTSSVATPTTATFAASNFTNASNLVAVSMGGSSFIKRSQSVVEARSQTPPKINGTMKIITTTTSASAPNSPIKTVKMQPQATVSANVSPAATTSSSVATAGSAAAATASSFVKPPPKPQEDPDTLKRIQQILDDYNEQIRNSPDLQNRPAPRRRTNGPPTPTSTAAGATTTTPPSPPTTTALPSAVSPKKKRPSLSSGSPNSSSGSESPLFIQSHHEFDAGSSSVVQISPANLIEPGQIKQGEDKKPVLRQIMVPPALAASLQATGRQLMVITGPGGKKMIALKPLATAASSASTTNVISTVSKATKVITTSSSVNIGPLPPRVTSVTIGGRLITTSPTMTTTNTTNTMHVISNHSRLVVSTSASSSPTMASSATTCSPSPPSLASSASDDRPVTPGLGIPMEMTPGQIMEAEISATFLDEDDVHTQHQTTSSSIHHIRGRGEADDDLESDTLPENLFTQDQPPSPMLNRPPIITEETEVDTDDVAEDEASSVVINATKRKRPISGHSDETSMIASINNTPVNKRLRQNSNTLTVTSAVTPSSGMRTRQRNLSSHALKKATNPPGIGIIESSRSSIKKS